MILAEECRRLRYRVAELEDILGIADDYALCLRKRFKLPPQPAHALGFILSREIATHDALYTVLWGNLNEDDQPLDVKQAVKHIVWRIRVKLRPYGIEIETGWGTHYTMTRANKQKLSRLLEDR